MISKQFVTKFSNRMSVIKKYVVCKRGTLFMFWLYVLWGFVIVPSYFCLVLFNCYVCACVLVAQSCLTLQPNEPRLLCLWGFPGKNIGVDCHFLLNCNRLHLKQPSGKLNTQHHVIVILEPENICVGLSFSHLQVHQIFPLLPDH